MLAANNLKYNAHRAVQYKGGVPFRSGIVLSAIGAFAAAVIISHVTQEAPATHEQAKTPECYILMDGDRKLPCAIMSSPRLRR